MYFVFEKRTNDFIFTGHCCWKLYTRKRFRGKSLIIGGNTKIRNTRRAGFQRRVRSVRKIYGCTD